MLKLRIEKCSDTCQTLVDTCTARAAKQLLIGPAKGMAVKYIYKEKCTKHTQHANARGVWGHAPQEIFEKACSEIASDSFLRANIPS